MVYCSVQPVTNYSYKRSDNIYSNPEYLRLMMTQMTTPNFSSFMSTDTENNNNNIFGTTNAYSGVSSNFYSDLIKGNSSGSITPQMELSIYGALIGKTITAVFDNNTIKGKVESVYMKANNVMINIEGTTFSSDNLIISKIE